MKKIFKVFVCCHKYIHRVQEIKARIYKWNLGDYLIFVGGEEEKQLEENVIQLKYGKISEITIDPKVLNVNAEKFDNLIGDDANFNANKMIEIFKGKDNDFSKAVCLNAAAGLIVSEKFTNFLDAYNFSREFILSGKPYSHLEKIQNV